MHYDFNSRKYILLLMLICFIFAIFIIKAFDYLPAVDTLNNINSEDNINTPAPVDTQVDTNINNITVKNTSNSKTEQKHGVLYKSEDSLTEEPNFDYIKAPKGAIEEDFVQMSSNTENQQLTQEDLALKSIIKAKKSAASGDYTNAINEYQKVAEYSNDNEISAQCYEGIADLYAKQQKYPTALSFAGKAYNSSPSIAREVLIAKIYYSAGKTDIAIKRINNLLKRGFEN